MSSESGEQDKTPTSASSTPHCRFVAAQPLAMLTLQQLLDPMPQKNLLMLHTFQPGHSLSGTHRFDTLPSGPCLLLFIIVVLLVVVVLLLLLFSIIVSPQRVRKWFMINLYGQGNLIQTYTGCPRMRAFRGLDLGFRV